jgi:hypothetical protein
MNRVLLRPSAALAASGDSKTQLYAKMATDLWAGGTTLTYTNEQSPCWSESFRGLFRPLGHAQRCAAACASCGASKAGEIELAGEPVQFIEFEAQGGTVSVRVRWPMSAAASCAA